MEALRWNTGTNHHIWTYRTLREGNPPKKLRGPAAILFISRDACSDSIAKLFCACFVGYRTIIARYVAKWGLAPFWGSASVPSKVSRDMGYRSNSIAISRDMGPLSQKKHPNKNNLHKLFLPASAYFKGKRGDNLYKLFRNCLRKLFFYLGGCFFGGGSPLHEYR